MSSRPCRERCAARWMSCDSVWGWARNGPNDELARVFAYNNAGRIRSGGFEAAAGRDGSVPGRLRLQMGETGQF